MSTPFIPVDASPYHLGVQAKAAGCSEAFVLWFHMRPETDWLEAWTQLPREFDKDVRILLNSLAERIADDAERTRFRQCVVLINMGLYRTEQQRHSLAQNTWAVYLSALQVPLLWVWGWGMGTRN